MNKIHTVAVHLDSTYTRSFESQSMQNDALIGRSSSDSNDSEVSLRALEVSEGPQPLQRRDFSRARSYSVSGFDFQQELLPLSASLSNPEELTSEHQEKNIGLLKGIALIVGSQIGSGIFSSPGVIVANVQSIGASLIVWIIAGLLGWTGASSYAELGSAIPVNGGSQSYLAYAYGPLVSFLFAWTAILALKPGGAAVISLIFAEYMNRIFTHGAKADVTPDDLSQVAIKLTAIGSIVLITLLCIATTHLSTRAAVFFTIIKVAALMVVIALGGVHLFQAKVDSPLQGDVFENSSRSPSAYSLALYSGLWAYDGWDSANYVGGEMRNPEKNMPRAIHVSMGVVTCLFVLANVSYFLVLDKVTVAASNTVGMDFGRALFGPVGGSIFAFMVAFSCAGALNNQIFTSSRLVCAAAQAGYLPKLFGKLHSTRRTPVYATLLQATIASAFVLIGGGFRSLVNFSIVASWAFFFLTVLGLVILRVKEPALPRPYKTWIVTPLTFASVALFLLCMPIFAAPLEALAVLCFVLTGIPVYYLTQRNNEGFRTPVWAMSLSNIFRGRPSPSDGWQAVATDETIEMRQGH